MVVKVIPWKFGIVLVFTYISKIVYVKLLNCTLIKNIQQDYLDILFTKIVSINKFNQKN